MSAFLTILPLPYRILALTLLAAAIWAHGWLKGAHHEQAKSAAFQASVAVRMNGADVRAVLELLADEAITVRKAHEWISEWVFDGIKGQLPPTA